MVFIWFFVFLFIVGGMALIVYSASINEILEGKMYMIEIAMDAKDLAGEKINPLYIQDFLFYYDFSSQEGNISFRIPHDLYFENLNLIFPVITNNKYLEVFVIRADSKIPLELDRDYEHYKYNSTTFSEASSHISILPSALFQFQEKDRLVVQFRSDINPKARFNFINGQPGKLFLYKPDKGQGNINFRLGRKYQCLSPCIYDFKNTEETPMSFEGDIKIKWNDVSDNNLFYINAFSRSKKLWKEILLSFGISLIVAGLVIGIERIGHQAKTKDPLLNKILDGSVSVKGIGPKTLGKLRKVLPLSATPTKKSK